MAGHRMYNTWRRVVRRYLIPLVFVAIPLAMMTHALVSTTRVKAGTKVWLDGEPCQAYLHVVLRGNVDSSPWLICSSRVEIDITQASNANVYGLPWHAERIDEPFRMCFRQSDGTLTGPIDVEWERDGRHNTAIRWDTDGRKLQVLWLEPMTATDLDGCWSIRNTIVLLSRLLLRGLLFAAFVTLVLLVVSMEPLKRGGRRCEQCGYDLRGLPDDGCPECGWGRTEI